MTSSFFDSDPCTKPSSHNQRSIYPHWSIKYGTKEGVPQKVCDPCFSLFNGNYRDSIRTEFLLFALLFKFFNYFLSLHSVLLPMISQYDPICDRGAV